jgi:hypothetical protein
MLNLDKLKEREQKEAKSECVGFIRIQPQQSMYPALNNLQSPETQTLTDQMDDRNRDEKIKDTVRTVLKKLNEDHIKVDDVTDLVVMNKLEFLALQAIRLNEMKQRNQKLEKERQEAERIMSKFKKVKF